MERRQIKKDVFLGTGLARLMIAEIVGAASARGQPVQAQLPRLINVRRPTGHA